MLRFGRKPLRLTIVGPNGHRALFSSSLRGGVLTVTLNNSKSQVTVTISYPAITAIRREVAAARRGRPGKLRVSVTASDAQFHPTALTAVVKPRS